MHLGILTSHPIQYHTPWFRELAKVVDLEVFFAHRQSAAEQGKAGFGVAFEWDVDLLSGYQHQFLKNVAPQPNVSHFTGCDTPEIAEIISGKQKPETPCSPLPAPCSPLPAPCSPLPAPCSAPPSSISNLQSSREAPFDAFIVTGWYLKSYLQAVDACRAAGVPVLVRGDSQLRTPRSLLKRLAMEVRQRWLLRKFDGFLTVGQRNREYLEHYGVPARKIFSAPHFVDNEWFAARAAQARNPLRLDRGESDATLAHRMGEGLGVRALGEVSSPSPISHLPSPISDPPSSIFDLRKSWGADEQTLVALFVGKFIPKKRPGDLLRAMATLNSQLSTFKLLAVFVGSGELGPQLRASTNVVFDADSPLRLDSPRPKPLAQPGRGEPDATLAHRMGEGLGVRALGEVSNPGPNLQPSTLKPQSPLRSPLRLDRGEGQGEVSNPDPNLQPSTFNTQSPLRSPLRLDRGEGQGEVSNPDPNFQPSTFNPQSPLRSPLRLDRGEGQGEVSNPGPNLQPSTFNPQLPRASFAGFKNQTELPACYAAADVLVLPSDGGETWGLVVNEAMACGLPAIVSDAVGCAPDLVEDGKTGFVYPVGDVEALARRLQQFAELRAAGHDFRGALEERMRAYSVEAAVRGTVQAAETLAQ